MLIDIYRSTKNSNTYLSVPSSTDISALNLPSQFHPFEIFKTKVELDPTKPHIALNHDYVVTQIEKNGVALHEDCVTVEIKEGCV